MNVQLRDLSPTRRPGASQMAVADCDIHPVVKSKRDLYPYLSQRWQSYLETYGTTLRQPYEDGKPAYPKGQPNAARRDAWPPGGGLPGSDLDFMRQQHLDSNNVQFGIVNLLGPTGQGFANPEFSAAMATANNHWQLHELLEKEPRLKGSIVVPYENPEESAKEINRWADNSLFVQVLLLSRTADPLGQRKYWPIYEAAVRANRPIGIHAFGYGGHPITGSGWPSYYIEEMTGHAQACQAQLTSLIMEGVFERFPSLKIVMIEAGFAWLPPLAWRLDKVHERLRDETPHLKRRPSEYLRDHVWLTTQPMEEPEPRIHLLDTIEWIGWDRLLFATDYPHCDFDDPAHALPLKITEEQRRLFFIDNAKTVYGLS